MNLSNDMVSQFVKMTNDKPAQSTTDKVYGTVVIYDNFRYTLNYLSEGESLSENDIEDTENKFEDKKEDHNKPLDNDEKARCKMISIILFLSFNIVGMFFTIVNASLGAVMFFTLVTDLFLLFVKSKEGGSTT